MSVTRLAWLLVLALLGTVGGVHAEPVSVRLAEGHVRGFLVLRSLDGARLANGELVQRPRGALLESRLSFQFKDGSLYDETVTFSQKGVLRLESYHLVQRGPSLPATDVAFDRKSGRYRATVREKDDDEDKVASGELEMPEDLYNGMALTIAKNLPRGAGARGHVVAFTPKPRLVKMEITPEGVDRVLYSGRAYTATRYLVKFAIGGVAGVLAPLVGKVPPELRYWIVGGDVPAFARFEGGMFVNAPVWRIDLAVPEWPTSGNDQGRK